MFRMNVTWMNQIDYTKISIKCKQNGVKISLKLDYNQLFIYYNKIIIFKKNIKYLDQNHSKMDIV